MNELKITDVVDQKALEQLERLKSELDSTFAAYKKAGDAMAEGLKIKPGPYSELISKAKDYYAAIEKVYALEDKIKRIQEEHEAVLKKLGEQGKQNVSIILQEAKANQLNADAELKVQKAETERLKQQKLINQERKKTKYTIEEANEALNQEIKTMRQAEEQNKILRNARKDLDLTTKEGQSTVDKFNSIVDRNSAFLKRNSDELVRAKMNVGKYRDDINKAAADILKGNISLKNMGNLAKSTGNLLKSSMGVGLAEVKIGTGSMVKGFLAAQVAMKGLQTLWTALKQGVSTAIEFEAANSKLAAILGTTSDKIKDLKLSARDLGATTKYTAAEATNLQIELAKLGFTAVEIQQSTKYVLQFAQATGAELPEAAALAGAALRMFNADTTETERYVSAMAVATTKSALSFSYLQTAMPIAGSVAKTFGFEIEDVLALLGKLADAGVDASSAATATRNILLNLADGGGKLSKTLGGNIKTLDDFVNGLKNVKDRGIELAEMLDITDKRSVNAFANFVNGAEDIEKLRESVTGVTDDFAKMAEEMGNNTAGALKGLSSAWDELMISIYGNTGIIRDVVELITDAVRDMATLIESTQQAADKIVNKGKTYSATDEDYKRDIDAVEKRTKVLVDAGEKETVAMEKAKKEQLNLLNSSLEQENKALAKAKQEYENAYANSINENASEYIRENAKSVLKTLAIEYSTIQSSVNVLEARKKRLEGGNQNVNSSAGGATLTDKELEKQRKERLRIQQEYQQSELDLMDEGLGKELAKIRLNYTKRIAAVKGNTQEEIKTRENLAIAMEDELSEKIYTYNQNKEKIDLQNRLEALSTNSKEELDQRLSIQLQINEILRSAEIQAARKNGEDVNLIKEKYEKKRNDIVEKNMLTRVGLIEKNTKKETNIVQNSVENQLRAVELQYRKGEINEKEYRQKTYEITRDSIQAQLQLLEAQLKAELAVLDSSDTKSDALKDKIEKVKAEIGKLNSDIEDLTYGKEKSDRQDWADGFIDALSNMRDKTEEYLGETASLFSSFYSVIDILTKQFAETGDFSLSKWWEKLDPTEKASMILQAFGELFNGITSIVTSAFDARIEQIEEEKEKNEEAGEEEKERIEDLVESGVITKEEGEARKRAADKATADKNKELEKQKAELEQRQAKWQKANSIVQTTIATSLAIMQAFAQAGPIAGAVLAAVIGAMGAAQVAMIAAQPIPKYAKGTDNHPGGLAIVGDGGRQEVIETDNGAYITPAVPTLVDIPKRARVIPNLVDYRKMSLHSDALMLDRQRRSNDGDPVIVNVNNDYTRLERKFDDLAGEAQKIVRYLKKDSRLSDLRRIERKI